MEDRGSKKAILHPRSSILGYLVLRQLDAIAVRIGDVDRVPRALAVHSRLLDLDTFGLQRCDQFLRIVWPLDVEGVMRHAGKLFFRSIEQAKTGVAGAQAVYLDSGLGLFDASEKQFP